VGDASDAPLMFERSGHETNVFGVNTAFLVLFPGFTAYHFAVTLGVIPPLLGGYGPAAATLIVPFVALTYARRTLRDPRVFGNTDLAFFVFLALFALTAALHGMAGANPEILRSHVVVLVQFAATFLLTAQLDLTSPRTRRVILSAFGLVSAVAVANANGTNSFVSALILGATSESKATYQSYALIYFVVAVLLLSLSSRRLVRSGVAAIAIPIQFLIGARAEFIALLVAVVIAEFIASRARFAVLITTGALISAIVFLQDEIALLLPESRVLSLLEYGADGSVIERRTLADAAYETIRAHPVLGAYASYPAGSYIHNVLSAWVDLGFFGFVLLMSLATIPVLRLMSEIRTVHAHDPTYMAALATTLPLIVLLAAAKNYEYQLIPVALGLYARHSWRRSTAEATSWR
jgi:hypothetical protein